MTARKASHDAEGNRADPLGIGCNGEEGAAPPNGATFEGELLASIEAVYRFALWLTQDSASAQDLAQETYARALANREQYTIGTRCRAWLFTICRNLFLLDAKHARRERQVLNLEREARAGAELHADVEAVAAEARVFERRDFRDAVARALARLPEEYRTAVTLVDIEDQSYEEASRVLGVPVGTVRSRLFRARRLLQRDLRAYAEDAGLLRVEGRTP